MDGAWVHNLSPFLIEFSEGFGVRYYGLAYLIGFFLAYFVLDGLAKRNKVLLSRELIPDLITYVALGTLAGGRLGYVLFYSPELLWSFHASFPFWGVLEVHKGGMASHGGILGIAVATMMFSQKHKIMATHLLDVLCLSGPLGVFFGRIANFINGELNGRECPPDLWMAVKFPSEIYTWGSAEATKLHGLGAAAEALGTITTRAGEKISVTATQWSEWVNVYSFQAQRSMDQFKEAIVLATQKHNPAVLEALAPVLTPRYPSQLIQALLEGLLVFLILGYVWRKPRKPGLITALFGLCYAVNRVIGEQFRLPDFGIGYQALGLTRGQWLSIAMFIVFTVFLILVLRRRTERIGGWGE